MYQSVEVKSNAVLSSWAGHQTGTIGQLLGGTTGLPQGTGLGQRIGAKVFLKYTDVDIFLTGAVSNNEKQWVRFHFFVQRSKDGTGTYPNAAEVYQGAGADAWHDFMNFENRFKWKTKRDFWLFVDPTTIWQKTKHYRLRIKWNMPVRYENVSPNGTYDEMLFNIPILFVTGNCVTSAGQYPTAVISYRSRYTDS